DTRSAPQAYHSCTRTTPLRAYAAAVAEGWRLSGRDFQPGCNVGCKRRWHELEAQLIGRPLEPAHAADMAEKLCGGLRARDGVEAPGWYRLKVLPSLVRKAVGALRE